MTEHEQWLQDRKSGIGASDASAVIGCNPYKSNVAVYEEKAGLKEPEDISEKEYVKYGTEAETHLRALFALDYPIYDVTYGQFEMIRNPKFPFIFATLDGKLLNRETQRQGVLEIKTTNILQSMTKERWNDRIPDNYFCQCLHQLLATGWDFVILKAQLKTVFQDGEVRLNTKHYTIERKDVLEDMEYLKQEEIKFWKCVESKTRPNLVLPRI